MPAVKTMNTFTNQGLRFEVNADTKIGRRFQKPILSLVGSMLSRDAQALQRGADDSDVRRGTDSLNVGVAAGVLLCQLGAVSKPVDR